MSERKKSATRYLQNNGPSTLDELPTCPRADERHAEGIEKMIVRANSKGSSWDGKQVAVYYLETETPESVVRKYLSVNPALLDNRQMFLTQIFGRAGMYFKEAWLNISDEYDLEESNTGGGNAGNTNCPFCDKEIFNSNLPDHIVKEHSD